MKFRHVVFALLVIAALYLVWLTIGVISYRQYNALPVTADSPWEVEGAYHIHTTLSDGFKSPEAVAKIAARSSLDFIFLTDHGNPNREAPKSEGWREGVLVLAGSELNTNRGHLVALGYKLPDRRFSPNADNAARQIRQLNGFSVIAHPYSKTHWTWGDTLYADGIEIVNADSMLKRNISRWLPFLPSALVSPKYFTLKILDFPEQNIRKWNELSLRHKIYAYFSTDAHALYRTLFAFLRIHVLLDEPLSAEFEKAKQQVSAALKEGRFYNAVEAAAEADGFRFWAEIEGEKIPMGRSEAAGAQMIFNVQSPFPFATETLLLFNGETIYRSSEAKISFRSERPGTYRVEVYLTERSPLSRRTPWIVSNPIFIMEKKP
jgi:hypothetical protein